MTRTCLLVTSLCLLALSFGACSGSSGGSGGSDGAGGGSDASGGGSGGDGGAAQGSPVALDAFGSTILDAACELIVKCGQLGFVFTSKDSCKAFLGDELLDSEFAKLRAEVGAGSVSYDAQAAGDCIAAYKAIACEAATGELTSKGPVACRKVFTGKAAIGSSCERDEHCASTSCDRVKASGCPGKCAELGATGASCQESGDCEGELVCVAGKCAPNVPAAVGASCDGVPCVAGAYCGTGKVCAAQVDAGGACASSDKACKDGLYCSSSGPQQTCAPRLEAGTDCKAADACEPGLVCAGASTGNPGICKPTAKLGGACTSHVECGAVDVLCKGAEKGTGACAPLPAKGEACVQADPFAGLIFSCKLPYACDPKSSVCVDPPTVGQACTILCATGLSCTKGVCTAPAGEGGACTKTDQCKDGLVCTASKCATPVCP